jgi:predicted Fe-Mo cluster-binding NifX family protein
MSTPTPVPTTAPSAYGLSSYIPMSSYTNPMAAGYQVPMSNVTSGQLNAAGQSYYAGNGPAVVAKTNGTTGALVTTQPTPQPGPAPTTPQAPSGPSAQDQLNSQLDAIFAPVMSALQGQESTAQNNYNIQTGDINQQGAAAQSTLDAQNTSGTSQLDQLGTTAGQTKSDALTAATELYNELSRGGQQRFGGSSSAGEAYGALTAVEQQKRQGAIQTAFSNAMDQVAQYKNTLLTNYTAAKTNLTSQINSQLASATQNFNDAISSIKSAEGQAASDKAQATLNTLQDYRNKVYTINLQGQQAMQALEQQGTVSMSAVDNYTQQMLTSLQNGSNTVVNMATSANNAAGTTKLGVGTAPTTTTLLPTGSTTTNNTTNNTTVANYVKYPHDGFTY